MRRKFNGDVKSVFICRGCGRPSLVELSMFPSSQCPHCRRHIVWLKEFGGPSSQWCGLKGISPADYLYVANEEPA